MSNVHVGSMGWSYDFWKPNFYPKSLASSDFLAYYSKQFNTVEVDSTFYRIPRSQSVQDWKDQTSSGFLFSLKFPQIITHIKMLKDCEEETRIFLERVELLGEKLGPLLLQFPPTFHDEQLNLLSAFLKNMPTEYRYAVEVRNKNLLNNNLYSILRENNAALAWVDSAYMPFVDEITSDFLYFRLEGDRKKINGTLGKIETAKKTEIKSWAKKLKPIVERKTMFFGYFSKYYSGFPPSDIHEFLQSIQA